MFDAIPDSHGYRRELRVTYARSRAFAFWLAIAIVSACAVGLVLNAIVEASR